MTLRISSNFDSGAIEVLSLARADDIRLRIRADQGIHGDAAFRQWFHFRLHGAAGQPVRLVFENAAEAIMMLDADGDIPAVNRAFSEITGYAQAEVLGRPASILKSGRHSAEYYTEMWRQTIETGFWRATESADVDVVIMLRLQKERMDAALIPSTEEYFRLWGLDARRLKLAKPGAIVMHPGPMNRGVEIASDVADGPQSVILEQVSNGLVVRMAVMAKLMGASAA